MAIFRYFYTGTLLRCRWQVRQEFPGLQVAEGQVSIDQFGYKAIWKVGTDAKSLVEAALLAKAVLDAGRSQFNKLLTLKRQLACV